MLRLKNLSWNTPDGRSILKDINLVVPDGKLVVITGPNGSGKTTLARLIAGLEEPASGHILLNEEDITKLDVTEKAQKGISFAFQQPVRFKGITVKQLIETAAGGSPDAGRLCGILGNVGLCAKEYMDREVNSTLSGGEIKRIEIATVLARHTQLSVFDEPEAGIDLWSFKNLIDVFRTIRQDMRGSMIIISHQERILRIADEIVLLAEGTIKAAGNREEMLSGVMKEESVKPSCCREEHIFNERNHKETAEISI